MTVLDYSNPNGLRRALTGWCRKWSGSESTPPERGVATRAMGASVVVFVLTAMLAMPTLAQAQSVTIPSSNLNRTAPEGIIDVFHRFSAIQDGYTGALEWTLVGSLDDNAQFNLKLNGEINFVAAPDYEKPGSIDGDNIYHLTVRVEGAADASVFAQARVTVTVTDVDDTAPKLTSRTVGGNKLTLTYNEALDEDSEPAGAGGFTVTERGAGNEVTRVAVKGTTVTLTLTNRVRNNDAVTVGYVVPDDNPIQDEEGNDAGGIARPIGVTNLNVGPSFVNAVVDGRDLVLTYNEALDEASNPAPDTFIVTAGGDVIDNTNGYRVDAVGIDGGRTVRLRLTLRGVTEGEEVTIFYNATTRSLRDPEGNPAGDLGSAEAPQGVRNITASPKLSTAIVNDNKLALTFSEALDGDSTPENLAFTVTSGGATLALADPGGVAVKGTTVTLTLAASVLEGAAVVRVTYKVPPMMPIQDAAAEDAAVAFARVPVVNVSKLPTYVSSTVDGDTLVLVYSEALDEGSTPVEMTFTVTTGSSTRLPMAESGGVAVKGTTVILTLLEPLTVDDTVVRVAYAPPETMPIQDKAGNAALALKATVVGNTTAGPTFVSAIVNRNNLELTFSEPLDEDSVPAGVAFTVMVEDTYRAVTDVAVEGAKVTLTLVTAVMHGDAVTVSYDVPGTRMLRDKARPTKNDVANIPATVVTNNTPASTPPTLTSATVDGATLTLTYGEPLDEDSVPAATDFTVMVGSDPSRTVTGVDVKGSAVILTLAARVRSGEVVTVSYTPGTNPVQDVDGNADPGWTDKAVENDTDDPVLTTAIVDGSMLTLAYDEVLDETSTPVAGDFTVQVASDPDRAISGVNVSGSAVTLTLSSAVLKGEAVTVSYRPGTQPIQDAVGNDAAALNKMEVDNVTAAPALITTDGATVKDDKLVLTYGEALDEGSQPAASDFTVMVAGEARMVSSAVVSGSMVTLTLASAVMPGEAVMVSYAPGTNPIQDMAEYPAPPISKMVVTNGTIIETPPKFSGATVDGATLVLTYDEALDEESVPAPSDYVVKAGSQMAPVSSVAVSGSMVTLMLVARVEAGEFVTVSYTAGDNPVQDMEGTPDPGWPAQPVDNITDPPMLTEATVDGAILTLMYDEDLDEESVPAASDFNVMVGSRRRAMVSPDGVAISGSMVTLMLAEEVREIDPVTISYTPGTNKIQDLTGNTAAAISNMPVRNSSVSPVGTESFEITDRGGVSITSSGTGGAMRVGYARIRADAGSTTPSGVAIFAFRDSEGVLISEAGVPATETVMEGRIFAEVYGPVNTGLAIANPNDDPATINFYFTDTSGTSFRGGSVELGANQQMARFLNEDPYAGSLPQGGDGVMGTFTFASSAPIAVTALRGLANEAGEYLLTTLPVAPLSSASTGTVYFPHFADGGGWATQVILVNPTNARLTGTIGFLGTGQAALAAAPVSLMLDGETGSSFDYSIPPNSSQRFTTSNPAGTPNVGSVRVAPSGGTITPTGLVIFSFVQDGKTVSEAAVAAMTAGRAFRAYAEMSGDAGEAGAVRTGLAITNATDTFNYVSLEIMNLDGTRAADTETILIPPSGQYAKFLDEIFDSLAGTFSGVLRIEGSAEVAVVGLRLRQNAMGELKMTTTPPSNEMDAATSDDRFFAHFVDSAGWSTQFILYTGTPGQAASGTLSLIGQSGQPLELTTQQ